MNRLQKEVMIIESLFEKMDGQNASNWQIETVAKFRETYPDLNDTLDFCFEVLAGKHKLGYKLNKSSSLTHAMAVASELNLYAKKYDNYNIKDFYNELKKLKASDANIVGAQALCLRLGIFPFMSNIADGIYKLGYSNKAAMITNKSPMLAKVYPDHFKEGKYYVQEKLNGNRCIAFFEDGQWQFQSRAGKPMKVNFDMTGLPIDRIFDGEVMTANKMGNKDFAATSGIINSKTGDKSGLTYFIYDILDAMLPYSMRKTELDRIELDIKSDNVKILKVFGAIHVSKNHDENTILNSWMDQVLIRDGEGLMLRCPHTAYEHKRSNALLKYKKTKTCDLRIIGWNEGKGKYEGMIGSFYCASDCGTIVVNVAGMTDIARMTDPNKFIGMIIEVAYFETSKAKNKAVQSLQFPRLVKFRTDKTETSLF